MKHKICKLSRHILLSGTLFPLAVCASYIALLCHRGFDFSYDLQKALASTGEVIALCVLVAVGGACLADLAWRERL